MRNMDRVSFVSPDDLVEPSTLVVTGMAIALFSAATVATAFIILAIISLGGFVPTLVSLMGLIPFAALPSVSVLRDDRTRIATTRRALIVASGATASVAITAGTTLFFVGLIDSKVTTAILWPLVVSAITFAWVMLCWGWVRLFYGRVKIVEQGDCLTCGYSLMGNQSGVCPECGQRLQWPTRIIEIA